MLPCEECENLNSYTIKVIDESSEDYMCNEKYHFEIGYKCTWNGSEGLHMDDLIKNGCRRIK